MNNKQESNLPDTLWDRPRFRNWIALIKAHRAVGLALTRELEPLSLKPVQLDVLMNVHRHPGLSQQELAERLLVGRSNITMLLPALEEQGLILRESDLHDKRIIRLRLTPHGEFVLAMAMKVYAALVDRVMAQSSEEECNLIGMRMTQIAEALKEK